MKAIGNKHSQNLPNTIVHLFNILVLTAYTHKPQHSFLNFLFQSVSHQKRMGFWEEFHLNSFIFLSGTPSLCCLGWVFGVCKSTPSTWCWCDYRNCKEWEYLSQEKRCVGFDLFAYVCLFGCGCVAAHAEIGKFFFSRFSLICRNLEDILIFNYLSVWVWM